MKKLSYLIILIILLISTPVYAQSSLTFAWEYDPVEAVHVTEWKLYQSNISGGPYALVPVSIMKVGNESVYDAVISSSDLLGGQVFFVLTAYGDASFPSDQRESGYSNEVTYTFTISNPFNLILTITPGG